MQRCSPTQPLVNEDEVDEENEKLTFWQPDRFGTAEKATEH